MGQIDFTLYSLPALISAIASISLAVYAILHRKLRAAIKVFWGMLFLSCWAFAHAMNLSAGEIGLKILFFRIGICMVNSSGIALLLIAVEVTEIRDRINSKWLSLLYLFPAFLAFSMLVPELRYLSVSDFGIEHFGPLKVLSYKAGPLFIAHIVIVSTATVFACLIYIRSIIGSHDPAGRARYAYLLFANLVPLLSLIPAVYDAKILNIASSTIWISAASYALAIFKYGLIDYLPVARDIIFGVMPDPVLILDEKGTVIYANNAARASFVGTDEILDALKEMSEPGFGAGGSFQHLNLRGKYWDIKVTPLFVNGTNPQGKLVLLRDVTAEKVATDQMISARMEAESASASKSRFLSVMSHEMRTPVHNMAGIIEMLRDDVSGGSNITRLQLLERSCESLKKLLDDALDRSLLESGRLVLEEDTVSLKEIVQEIEGYFAKQADEKGLFFKVVAKNDGDLVFKTDRRRLVQVLSNLVSNAIKYTGNGGITLTAGIEPCGGADTNGAPFNHGKLIIRVNDTGVGIPAGQLNTIFEPFERIADDGRINAVGTGLGLSITRDIVALMSGSISVESTPGSGSSFTVVIPVNAAASDRPEPPPIKAKAPGFNGLKLLIVDDLPENIELIRQFFQGEEVEISGASGGLEAVNLFRTGRFDCAIVDLQIPEMDGLAVAREIRRIESEQQRKAIWLIALSADAFFDGAQALASGFDLWLVRPVSRARLKKELAILFESSSDDGNRNVGASEDLRQRALLRCTECAKSIVLEAGDGKIMNVLRNAHALLGLGLSFNIPAAGNAARDIQDSMMRMETEAVRVRAQRLVGDLLDMLPPDNDQRSGAL